MDAKEKLNLPSRQIKRRSAWNPAMFAKHDYVQKIKEFVSQRDQRAIDRDKRRTLQGIKK